MFSVNVVNSDIRPYVVNKRQSTGALPALQSAKIIEQVRERIRYLHYSIRTEESYLYWIRNFILWREGFGNLRDKPRFSKCTYGVAQTAASFRM